MNTKIWTWTLILASVAAGLFLRALPAKMVYLDNKALEEVRQDTAQAVEKSIARQYPQMEESSVRMVSGKVLEQTWKDDKAAIGREAAQRGHELKEYYRDQDGHLYLAGIDSYYWLRLLENLLQKGHIGDTVVDGKPYDALIDKPIDPATTKNIHIWLGFLFYKAGSFFNPAVPLRSTLFFIPLVLSCVIGIVAFFAARKLGCNHLGSFMASIAVNLSPFLINRMVVEWFDTDIYNVLFPLLILTLFLYSVEEKARMARRVILCALSGLCVAFYASTWQGWWFIFDIMIISGLLFMLNAKLSRGEEAHAAVTSRGRVSGSLALFFGWASVFVVLLNGFSVWADCLFEPLRLAHILNVTETSMWPNVYQTVAELAPIQPGEVVGNLGGQLVFFSALLGFIYVVLFERGLRDPRYGFGLLCLGIWITTTFYSALEASRFALLLVAPVGLAFGVAVTKAYEFADEALRKYLNPRQATLGRLAVVALLALYPVSSISLVAAQVSGPSILMNDQWYDILTRVKKNTPENAIINSWWDFGHWFKSIAQRRVLFDGMTQNTPYAYWTALALLTDDPRESLGILRMINTSGNDACDELTKSGRLNLAQAVALIRRCVRMDEAGARSCLKESLNAQDAETILGKLFPRELPPVYLIVSYDMPSKIGPISYIGNWDFQNVDLWFKQKKKNKQNFLFYAMQQYDLNASEAEGRYMEMLLADKQSSKGLFSSFLKYYSTLSQGRRHAGMLYFENGLVADSAKKDAVVASGAPDFLGVPQNLYYMEGGSFKEARQENGTLKFSGLLIEKDQKLQSILCDTDLARSMLIRLYFYEGRGLEFVRMFDQSVDEDGNAIYVYEIVWQPEKASKAKSQPGSKAQKPKGKKAKSIK
ncbi:MAG: STT3 domain-containing protein [Candidatus Omnitrophota bacterium]